VARKYLVFVLLIGLVSMVGPVAAADLARSPAGDYYMENPQGQVGSLHIEEISADRLKFSMHVAIPAICGTGMEGEAKWSGDRAVYSDDFCKKLIFRFELGKVTLEAMDCGFGPEDKCTFNCTFTNEFTPPGAEEEIVKDIRMHYAAVNSQTSWLESVEFESKGWGGSGEKVQAYLYEGEVRKITVTQPLKSGLHTEEYYFWLKRLIFCFTGKTANTGQSDNTPMTDVERYYFSHDKLIRWLDSSGQQVSPKEKRFQERQKDILEKAKDLSTKALAKVK
jgi:hypothetical protein